MNYNKNMRIDFHCHTMATKSGDKPSRNVKVEIFRNSVLDAKVKIVCITNHNVFDLENYKELKASIEDDGVLLLPGIELDVMDSGSEKRHFHATIIFDDNEIDEVSKAIRERTEGKTPDDTCLSLDGYIDLCNEFRCVTAVHYWKNPSPSESAISYIKEKLDEKVLFFYEPSSYKSLDILVSNARKSIIGSDVTNWENYKNSTFTETKIEVRDFNGLYNLLSRDKQIIETFLNGIESFSIDISKKGAGDIVNIYCGTNIIFGNKASGKSEALDKIKKYFERRGKEVSFYDQDENGVEINKLLEVDVSEKNLGDYNAYDCRDEFEALFSYKNELPLVVNDLERFIKTNKTNKNIDRLKITDIKIPQDKNYNADIKRIDKNYGLLQDINKKLHEIDDRYISDKIKIEEILKNVWQEVFRDHTETVKSKITLKLLKQLKDSTKSLVEKNTSIKNRPETVGFTKMASNFFASCIALERIRQNIDFSYVGDEEYVMQLETNKKIGRRLKVCRVTSASKASDGFSEIQKLKIIRRAIDNMVSHCSTPELDKDIEEFNKCELNKNTFSLEDLTAYKREFVVNGAAYVPSSGEETMMALEKKCDNSFQVYVFDEPEKSLGNSYVSGVLIPKLRSLDKQNKIIVIATHNANVAVNTTPLESILKTYDGYSYNTYSGNSYSNELVNIKDGDDIKDWKKETIDILEGGRAAFDERSEVYGKD